MNRKCHAGLFIPIVCFGAMSQPASVNTLEKYVGRSTSTSKAAVVLNKIMTAFVVKSLFKVALLLPGNIFSLRLHSNKEDEAKLIFAHLSMET